MKFFPLLNENEFISDSPATDAWSELTGLSANTNTRTNECIGSAPVYDWFGSPDR
jgi:hypothetical protein